MSHYSKLAPRFWTGATGRSLRGDPEAQIVAAYLITSPHANMLGFFYQPISYIATDTGLPIEGASKALRRLCEGGFCHYDESSEVVWVVEMARFQIGDALEAKDKRVTSIRREYESLPNNRLLQAFFDRYGKAYHMNEARAFEAPCDAPSHAPSKPAAVTAAVTATASTAEKPSAAARRAAEDADDPASKARPTWKAYIAAIQARYPGRTVLRDETANSQMAKFVKRVGVDDGPKVAALYVSLNKRRYVDCHHSVATMLACVEELYSQWTSGRQITEAESRQADQTSARVEQVQRLTREKAA